MVVSASVDFICLSLSFGLSTYVQQMSVSTLTANSQIKQLLDGAFNHVFASIILTIIIFIRLGLYRAVVRFLCCKDVRVVLTGVLIY